MTFSNVDFILSQLFITLWLFMICPSHTLYRVSQKNGTRINNYVFINYIEKEIALLYTVLLSSFAFTYTKYEIPEAQKLMCIIIT